MQSLKTFLVTTRSKITSLDYADRKVQVSIGLATVGTISTLLLIKKFSRKRNFWDDVPPYAANTVDELGDPVLLANIKRCRRPSDELEIVYAKKGSASTQSITMQSLWDLAVKNGGDTACIALEELDVDNKWEYKFTSWNEMDVIVNRIAAALIAIGVNQFDVINIIGESTPLFHQIFWGIMMAAAIPGGCYTTNGCGSLEYICNLCKSKVVFAENRLQLNKYLQVMDALKTVKYIVVYDDDCFDEEKIDNQTDIKIITFTQLLEFGKDKSLLDAVKQRKASVKPQQCACLIYTSGTTGGSKGCMLSHDNIFYTMHSGVDSVETSGFPISKNFRQLAYLPLSHMVGQIVAWWGPIYHVGGKNYRETTYYCRKDWKKTMKFSLKACKPTQFLSVPRLYEKFYETITSGLSTASLVKRSIFNFVLWIGKSYYLNTCAGGSGQIPYLWPFVSSTLCDGMIKKAMGFDECSVFISGGAPLSSKIREMFGSLNICIGDGYGLSECVGGCTLARRNNFVAESVGSPLVGTDLLIDYVKGVSTRDKMDNINGEICIRGRSVMMGYIYEYEKTQKVFDSEGWFHSGDIGHIDKFGCLYITGRIKELIVTAGGKNVAPVPVENYIKKLIPSLSQAIMIGDKRKYCSMIVSIATELDGNGEPTTELQSHAKLVNPKVSTVSEAMNDPIWHITIIKAIDRYNNDEAICASNSAKIKYFQILPTDLTVHNGALSDSLKVKRFKLFQIFKNEIGALYGDNPQIPVSLQYKK